jgi:hypothetical protein
LSEYRAAGTFFFYAGVQWGWQEFTVRINLMMGGRGSFFFHTPAHVKDDFGGLTMMQSSN